MKSRLHTRSSMVFLAGILLCILGMLIITRFLVKPLFLTDSRWQMQRLADEIEKGIDTENFDMNELLNRYNESYLFRTMILDDQDQMLYATSAGANLKRPTIDDPNARRFLEDEKNKNQVTRFETQTDPGSIRVARLIYIRYTDKNCRIVISKSIKGIEQEVNLISLFLIIAGVVVAVLSMIIWRILSRPYSRLQEDMSEMQTELERRRSLIRNLAHEIRTPLTTIQGYAENLPVVAAGNEKIERYSNIMLEECEALNLLSAEMLDMSSFEQGNTSYYEMKEIYMEAVFEKIRQRAAMEYPDRKLVLDVKDCGVPANEKLILRVLMNYVKNAFSYSAPDSEVTLRGDRKNNYYRIEVINKGEPIPKEERELIWDAFYKMEKARSRGSGYGVGLSIVREIAMMHHAKYGVHCENGLVTFYFSLQLLLKHHLLFLALLSHLFH